MPRIPDHIIYSSLLLLACTATACSEFIEPSLTNKQVNVLAPADNVRSSDYNQTFFWDPVDGALKYQLQIAAPSFDAAARIVTDTTIGKTNFTYSLQPGKYQWRVRAVNGSSQTPYVTRRLDIDTASLNGQTVQLVAPTNGRLINTAPLTLQWQPLFGAKQYRLQLDSSNFSGSAPILEQVLPGTSYTLSLANDAVYQWRVKAENDTAQSQYSAVFSFTLDRTAPAVPTLSTPANNTDKVDLPVTLQWTAAAGASGYKLYVYKSDGVTLYDSTFPLSLGATSYRFNKGSSQEKIFWQVKAVDAAGNESDFSSSWSFTLR